MNSNIISFYEFYEDNNFFYIVFSFYEGDELFDRIIEKWGFNEKETAVHFS